MKRNLKKMLASILTVAMVVGLTNGFTVAASEHGLTLDETTKSIYANGQAITLTDADDGTAIYVDDAIVTDLVIGEDADGSDGYDLSAYTIYGGSKDVVDSTTASITMEGGEVAAIYAGGAAILTADVEAELEAIIATMYDSIDGKLDQLDAETLALLEALSGDVEDLVADFEAQLKVLEGDAEAIAAAAEEFAAAVEAELLPYILESSETYISESVELLLTELETELTEYAYDLAEEAEDTLTTVVTGSIAIATGAILGAEFESVDDALAFIVALEELYAFYEDIDDLMSADSVSDVLGALVDTTEYDVSDYLTVDEIAEIIADTIPNSDNYDAFDTDGFLAAIGTDGNTYTLANGTITKGTLYLLALSEFTNPYNFIFAFSSYTTYAGYSTSIASDIVDQVTANMTAAGEALDQSISAQITAIIPSLNIVLEAFDYDTLDEDASLTDVTSAISSLTKILENVEELTAWSEVLTDVTTAVTDLSTDISSDPTTALSDFQTAIEAIELTEEQEDTINSILESVEALAEDELTVLSEYALAGFEDAVTTAVDTFIEEVETPEEYVERLVTELVDEVFADEIEAILEATGILVDDLDPAIYEEMIQDAIEAAVADIIDYLEETPEATVEGIFDIIVDAILDTIFTLGEVEADFIETSDITVTGGYVGTIVGSGVDAGIYVETVNITVNAGTYGEIVDTEYVFTGADLAVEDLGIDDTYLANYVLDLLSSTVLEQNEVNVTIIRSLVLVNNEEITVYVDEELADLEADVFDAVVNVTDSIPSGLTTDDVTIEYYKATTSTNWWGNSSTSYEWAPLEAGAFDTYDEVQIKVTLNDDTSKSGEVTLGINKYEVSLVLNDDVVIEYQDNLDDLKAAILAEIDYTASTFPTSWYNEDGSVTIDADEIYMEYEGTFYYYILGIPVSYQGTGELADVLAVQDDAYVVSLEYTGGDEYLGDVVGKDVTIVKATATIVVDETYIFYGDEIPADFITTTPDGVGYIALYTGVTTAGDLAVYIDLTNAYDSTIIDTILGYVDLSDTTFSGLSDTLDGWLVSAALSAAGVDTTEITDALDMLAITEDYVDITISFGQPTEAGAYVAAAVTISDNYNTAYDLGALAISPVYVEGSLSFNDELSVLDIEDFEAELYDLGYTSTIADGEYLETYTGTTFAGEFVFAATEITEPGVYYQSVVGASSNEIADPIGRILTLERYDVDLAIDGTEFTYDGDGHGVVTATNEDGTIALDSANITVIYEGINGTKYAPSSEMPVNAGDYKVTATYSGDAVYATTEETFEISIQKVDITVSVGDYTKTYGEEDPTYTVEVEGAVEDITDVFTVVRVKGESVGEYVLTVKYDGKSLSNYNVTVTSGTLEVLEAEEVPEEVVPEVEEDADEDADVVVPEVDADEDADVEDEDADVEDEDADVEDEDADEEDADEEDADEEETVSVPDTGDYTNITLWISLLGLSLVGAVAAFFTKKRVK